MLPPTGRAESVVTVLLVGSLADENSVPWNRFSKPKWRLVRCSGCYEALSILRQAAIPVVICHGHMADGSWKTLLKESPGLLRPPRVIVSSPFANSELFDEVRHAGGYGVVPSLDPGEAEVVVQVASRSWQRQWRNVPAPDWREGLMYVEKPLFDLSINQRTEN